MQNEPQADITSRPVYPLVEVNKRSSYHLFIGETLSDQLSQLYESCSHYDKKLLCILSETTDIYSDLQSFLLTASLNSTVYIDGTESFLWDMTKKVKQMGLTDDQIRMIKPVSKQRNVFCVHCLTITQGVTAVSYTHLTLPTN